MCITVYAKRFHRSQYTCKCIRIVLNFNVPEPIYDYISLHAMNIKPNFDGEVYCTFVRVHFITM